MVRLKNGSVFPDLQGKNLDGQPVSLPYDIQTRWGIVFICRGVWDPYCANQLKGFNQLLDDFAQCDTTVIALLHDKPDRVRKFCESYPLQLQLGFVGVDSTVEALGIYKADNGQFLQPAAFILQRDMVMNLTISTGPVGRLEPKHALSLVRHATKGQKSQTKPAEAETSSASSNTPTSAPTAAAPAAAPEPAPHSTAKPDEMLPATFKVTPLQPSQVSRLYYMPTGTDDADRLKVEIRHMQRGIGEDQTKMLDQLVTEMIEKASDDIWIKRTWPSREWARGFAVTHGEGSKTRHLLVSLGTSVDKKAKGLSYSKEQALEQYQHTGYFTISVLEECTLFGEAIETRKFNNWDYTMYSSRHEAIQALFFSMIPSLKAAV